MEEDKLKEVFKGFAPELPSDSLFMSKLQRRLDSVEIIRRHNLSMRKRSCRAVVIAGCVGFLIGFLVSTFLPVIELAFDTLLGSLPSGLFLYDSNILSSFVGWLTIAAISVIASVSAYDISLSFMRKD